MATYLEHMGLCAYESDPSVRAKAHVRTAGKEQQGRQKRACAEEGVPKTSDFHIDVRFLGGLTQSQMDSFTDAADRWSQIIVGDLQAVRLPTGEIVDDVRIDAQGVLIDGPGRILGQAGPRFIRENSLPATGIMQFDSADLQVMEANGSLRNVIIHEMGHVLGIGTIWDSLDLLVGCATANPIFRGQRAMEEFGTLVGREPRPVPVANTGGPGTRCGHWRETVFGHELMTGFLNSGSNPLSRMTIGSLEDLGYDVNYEAADPYTLPNPLDLALMGVGSDGHRQTCQMCGGGARPMEPIVLPESAFVD